MVKLLVEITSFFSIVNGKIIANEIDSLESKLYGSYLVANNDFNYSNTSFYDNNLDQLRIYGNNNSTNTNYIINNRFFSNCYNTTAASYGYNANIYLHQFK